MTTTSFTRHVISLVDSQDQSSSQPSPHATEPDPRKFALATAVALLLLLAVSTLRAQPSPSNPPAPVKPQGPVGKLLVPKNLAATSLADYLERVRAAFNPDLIIEGVLLTMYDDRTNLAQQVTENLREFFGEKPW